jgi:hypothetical protein
MKTITTLTAIAALVAGISIASAQNSGGPAGQNASPGNINKGDDAGTRSSAQSGSESSGAAMKSGGAMNAGRQAGNGKFCIQVSKGTGGIECKYTTMASCEKDAQVQGLQCSANPKMGTTGSK